MATVGPNLGIRPRPDAEVVYPERDGKPMAETDIHQDVMYGLKQALRDHFEPQPQVYVASNLFLYYQEGDPSSVVAPDVMVFLTAGHQQRRTFRTWEEGGRVPDLVVEVSSKSTRREDLREKLALYRDVLKVPEYVLFDPLGEYLRPPLRGFRLVGGEYQPIPPEDGRIRSEGLGLLFGTVGETLRLFDGRTGQLLPNRIERLRAADDAREVNQILEQRLAQAEARADRAEAATQRLAEQMHGHEEATRLLFETLRRELDQVRGDRGGKPE